MKKKLMDRLVRASFKDHELDQNAVAKISDKLKRSDLKQYLAKLKKKEKEQTVLVDLPWENYSDYKEKIKKLFPDKKIVFRVDPKIMLGIRIVNNDDLFEYNLDYMLENLLDFIEEEYD